MEIHTNPYKYSHVKTCCRSRIKDYEVKDPYLMKTMLKHNKPNKPKPIFIFKILFFLSHFHDGLVVRCGIFVWHLRVTFSFNLQKYYKKRHFRHF